VTEFEDALLAARWVRLHVCPGARTTIRSGEIIQL